MNALRIGWATPWNERSAIAQVAEEVAAELTARRHLITVLRCETGAALALPSRSTAWPVRALADVPDHALRQEFDVVVAHVGDSHAFHGALLPRLASLGAVGIFHDMFLADLLGDAARQPGGGGEAALRRMVRRCISTARPAI